MNISIRDDIEKEAFRICTEALLYEGMLSWNFKLVPAKNHGLEGLSIYREIEYTHPAVITYLTKHGLALCWPNCTYNPESREFGVLFNFDRIRNWVASIFVTEKADKIVVSSASGHCEKKGEMGYLVFDNPKEEIKIARVVSKQFRLLEASEPFGTLRSTDAIFNSVSGPVVNEGYGLYDPRKVRMQQKATLKGLMSELQRTGKLKGRVELKFTPDNNRVSVILKTIVPPNE